MLPFLKKNQNAPAETVEPLATPARDLSDFIPYYSHYNPHTLLTKNGEAMQIIRIRCNNSGLNFEYGETEAESLREHIREAITQAVASDKYALWIHTIRRRKEVHYNSKVADPFAAYMQEEWKKHHRWKYQYYNEIYISVLHEGQTGDLLNKKVLQHALLPKANRAFRNEYLDNAVESLQDVTTSILKRIRAQYQADRLGLEERNINGKTVFYSEPLEFLGTLINLKNEAFPLCDTNLSKELCTHALTFGFNALETKDIKNQRRFGALLSLKQYREITPETADCLLQAPIECIISQAFTFTPASRALKEYRIQSDILSISGDTYSIAASGLEDMLSADRGLPTDFGEMQTTVMVLADEYKHIDEEVQKAHEAFGEMGLIAVREDIKLEECFWAQLPGNFEFIRRKDIISTPRIGGFCRLNLFPDGKEKNNHWGDAVTLIPTYVNSPYFFNFHHRDNGHTVLFDFNAFRDGMGHILTNFLLTSTMKFNGRMYVFDRQHSAHLLFDKIKGHYHRFQAGLKRKVPQAVRLNPFSLDDTTRNRGFLLAWCITLLEPASVDETQKALLQSTIDQLYDEPESSRTLGRFIDLLAEKDYHTASAFRPYHGSGEHAGMFDGEQETLDLEQPLHAFDMDRVITHTPYAVALFAYLMHRIITRLDGKPTVIVLHEGFELLENPFFAQRLESLMEILTQNNAMLLVTTQRPEASVSKTTFKTLVDGAATFLCLPDDITSDYTTLLPMLSERDSELLASMDRQKGNFLFKQGNESIALRVNLDHMEDARAIFASDTKTLAAAGGRFASLPQAYAHGEDNV